jgi:hypothetical protein
MRIVYVGGMCLALLAACERPPWARQERPPLPVKARPASMTPEAPPPPPARQEPRALSPAALPALPDWALGLTGRPLAQAFPRAEACIGNTDAVVMRYEGAPGGSRIAGWGWEIAARRPVARVVLTDEAGAIIGAGAGGRPRRDVAQARPELNSNAVGWQALTARTEGVVLAYGVAGDGTAACLLGRIKL